MDGDGRYVAMETHTSKRLEGAVNMTKRNTIAAVVGLLALGAMASTASAGGFGFSFGYGGGGYCAPRYYAPVSYGYCGPRYYAAPVYSTYYAPARYYSYDCGPRY